MSLEQVIAALPPKQNGASIDVLDLVSGTTRAFLGDPKRMLVEDVGQKLPKLQGRIHIEKGDDNAIAAELVARGICVWKSLEEVVTYEGEKVLNGLFGVPKPSFTASGKSVLRLSMNLVPSNSILRQFQGATKHLPHITAWLSTFVEEGEELRIWQSDMQNAFFNLGFLHNGIAF